MQQVYSKEISYTEIIALQLESIGDHKESAEVMKEKFITLEDEMKNHDKELDQKNIEIVSLQQKIEVIE